MGGLLRPSVCLIALLGLPAGLFAQSTKFLNKPALDWARDLTDKQASVRRAAAFALGRLGSDALLAAPDLARCLKEDKEGSVRDMAAAGLGDIARALGNSSRGLWADAGPALSQALRDGDPRVRRSAAYGLGSFGPSAVSARAGLLTALKDKDASVRQNAAWALGRLGEEAGADTVRELAARLKDESPLVRRDAATAIGTIGPPRARQAVRSLLELARGENDEVVLKTALDQLVNLVGPDDRAAAGDVARLLRRPDPETARLAAFVLANLGGPQAVLALPILRQALRDPEPGVAGLGAAGLAGLGPAAAPALPDLVRLLTESTEAVSQRNALLALAAMGGEAGPAVNAIAEALKPGKPAQVRLYAAHALAQIGYPQVAKALPSVLDIIRKDADPAVRHRCVWVLFKVEDLREAGAVAPLAAALEEKDEDTVLVRLEAARILAARLKEQAPDRTVDVLLNMLQRDDLKVHHGTGTKVRGIGTEAAGGRSEVRDDASGDARYMSAEALGWLGRKSAQRPEVMKALTEAAKDSETRLREKAREALDRLRRVAK